MKKALNSASEIKLFLTSASSTVIQKPTIPVHFSHSKYSYKPVKEKSHIIYKNLFYRTDLVVILQPLRPKLNITTSWI